MDKNELIEKLKVIVKPYVKDEEGFDNLTEETDFINDLKINSANLVDVVQGTYIQIVQVALCRCTAWNNLITNNQMSCSRSCLIPTHGSLKLLDWLLLSYLSNTSTTTSTLKMTTEEMCCF